MNYRTIIGKLTSLIKTEASELRILMYHRVTDLPSDDPQLAVTVKNFALQMNWLKQNNWNVISLEEAVQQIKRGKLKKGKQVVITFDDGFADNYENAFPILKKYSFPATIFLIAGKIGTGSNYLNYKQLAEMGHFKISFEAHTVNHPNLRSIPLEEAIDEIISSKLIIEKIIGKQVLFFAYPGGSYNLEHLEELIFANYKGAVTITPGGNSPDSCLYSLRRTEIAPHDSLVDFQSKLSGGFDWCHYLVQYKQGLYPIQPGY